MNDDETVWHGAISLHLSADELLAADFDWPYDIDPPPTIACNEAGQDGITKLDIYVAGRPTAALVAHMIARLSALTGTDVLEPCFTPLPNRDWVAESQKLHCPIEVGRFVIFGAHDRDNVDADKLPIQMEAGQAFGTGRHHSTYGILKTIDWLAGEITPARVLDVGTGSGVLAMAAARAWDGHDVSILATDIDPVATETADNNIATNNISGVTCLTADGLNDPAITSEAPYDLILANILAEPLIALAPDIAANTAPGGYVVLSGLLTEQADAVRAAYEAEGLREVRVFLEAEWSILILTKN